MQEAAPLEAWFISTLVCWSSSFCPPWSSSRTLAGTSFLSLDWTSLNFPMSWPRLFLLQVCFVVSSSCHVLIPCLDFNIAFPYLTVLPFSVSPIIGMLIFIVRFLVFMWFALLQCNLREDRHVSWHVVVSPKPANIVSVQFIAPNWSWIYMVHKVFTVDYFETRILYFQRFLKIMQ